MIRRALATLIALLTLNVSAAEAMRVCAGEGSHDHPAPATDANHHAHHDASGSAPAETIGDCEKPIDAPETCCDAVSSCGTTLAIDGAIDDDGVIPDHSTLIDGTDRGHSAATGSPEPPPPKG